MPAPLNCFEIQRHQANLYARVRENVGRIPAREFGVELNLLRATLTEPGIANVVIEVPQASAVTADQLRGLVIVSRETRQRGNSCAFCGGGANLQQALGGFGFSKPGDWFATVMEAFDAACGVAIAPAATPNYAAPAFAPPVPPVRPQVAVPPPTVRSRAAVVPAATSARPAASRADGQKQPWQPPQRGLFFPAHELTLRAQHRQPILVTEQGCSHLAQQIRAVSDQMKFSVWAFVFMPDHFHLLVQSRQLNYDIGEYVEAIKQASHERAVEILGVEAPQVLNRLRKQQGGKYVYEFWQRSSGQNRNVEYTLPVRPLTRHLHENPVRRGLVDDPLDWKWSSAGAFAGRPLAELPTDPVPPELLGD